MPIGIKSMIDRLSIVLEGGPWDGHKTDVDPVTKDYRLPPRDLESPVIWHNYHRSNRVTIGARRIFVYGAPSCQ